MVSAGSADRESDRERWNRRFADSEFLYGTEPSAFLVEAMPFLPKQGRALDVAAGEGRNAVFLAGQGFTAEAIDISDVALAKAEKMAAEAGVQITTTVADLGSADLGHEVYDVVVVFNFLDRDLVPRILRSMRPGAVLVYETSTVKALEQGIKMRREYLLELGELKDLFADLEVLLYREDQGRASLVARKKPAE